MTELGGDNHLTGLPTEKEGKRVKRVANLLPSQWWCGGQRKSAGRRRISSEGKERKDSGRAQDEQPTRESRREITVVTGKSWKTERASVDTRDAVVRDQT